MKEAKLVYAIEPLPANYLETLDNIKLNNFDKEIVPFNVAISYKRNRIEMPKDPENYLRGSSLNKIRESGSNFVSIEAMTLRKLLEELQPTPRILKMDCEGCEYDVILNDYETMEVFDAIIFEYHSYETGIPINTLLIKLNNFRCVSVGESFYEKYFPDYTREELGMIYCLKK